jgi:TonB-linked SusC/RagA family outer membrane protein
MHRSFASTAEAPLGHHLTAAAALLAVATAAAPALLAAVALPSPAAAQATQGVVAGVVVAEGSQRPLADAQVAIEGTTLGAATDATGRFRVANVAGPTVRLTVRRIGYQPATVTARVGATDVRVTMRERALELSQVVVTGTAGVAERRAVGNAVTTVRAADVTATQPVRSVQDLLTGRAAGVSVVGSSGQVGTGSRIRVRGASSLSLPNDPLIYVDGIRVDNQQASGPTSQGFGSRPISRWNDFDPDDIESIEIIKGPAAATLYGTEASNGVVQIITKKGAAGRPSWNLLGRYGANWIPDWRDRLYTNYGTVPRAGGGVDTVALTTRQLNDALNARFGHDIFRTGQLRDLQGSVSGGSDVLRYFVSLNREENEGAERVNRLNRTNYRVNVAATPTRTIDVQASTAYTTGRTYLPYESGNGGATWATYFSSPTFRYAGAADTNPQLGFRSGPPDIYYQAYNVFQDVDRFTGGITVTHRPTTWLDHRLITGVDRLFEENQSQGPRNDPLASRYTAFADVGGTVAGFLRVGTRNVSYITADYAANARYPLLSTLQGVTSVGGQFYGRRTRGRESYAETFPASGLLSLSAAAVQRLEQDSLVDNNTVGGFVQQQLIWRDRLFLTGALRYDDNSAFGTDYEAVVYPKISASYVLSEEPALRIPSVFNTMRLRAAYGGSGLQPGAFDAIRTYNAQGGFLTPSNAGNPDLGPERSYELEAGLDAGVLDDRLALELTYFDGTTRDAILSRQAPPSAGFPGLQLFNAGRVDRSGLEWVVRATPLRRPNFGLDFTVSGSVVDYTIKSLGPNTNLVSVSGQVQHVVDHAPGAWWDRRIVSATFNPTTRRAENLLCDDGRGGTTACASAPRVFLGNSIPSREGSIGAGLTLFRNARINAFVDYRGGYKKLDGNARARCSAVAQAGCEEIWFPERFDPVLVAGYQGGTAYTYHLIRDASFTRFRELSLTYTLPTGLARAARATGASFTIAGRNLGLWTDYTGLEPEASFNGGTRGGQYGQWEQNVLPQLRQFVTTVNLTF